MLTASLSSCEEMNRDPDVRVKRPYRQNDEHSVLVPNVSSNLLRAAYLKSPPLLLLPYKQSDEHSAARTAATPNRPIHSGLPLRAKTGHHRTSAKLLAPGLAGARRNPFWVYFWLKSARGRRSKKMAVFFMVKGPIFGHFSPNLDLRRPKCRENSERPRFRPLSGHFSGG